jgi:hypothetical protein
VNQSTQVLDGYVYVPDKEAIKLEVISEGHILLCYIYGIEKQALITLYQSRQFDIEEVIELMVERSEVNIDGEIWLTAEQIISS